MLIYNLSIYFYYLAIYVVSFFNNKAKKWIVGRKKQSQQWPNVMNQKVIWFHCASLGEFEQAIPVIEKVKNDGFILITFFSPSGYEQKMNYKHADYVCYIPLDTPTNAKKFINHFHPKLAFFVKYEFWLNHIDFAHNAECKLYSLSTLMRKNQRFFRWYGGVFRKRLKKFSHFFVQNKSTKNLLENINIEQASITGDTRYDRVLQRKSNIQPNPVISEWLGNNKAWVIGSSWKKDEDILLPVINDIESKIIIAPHEIKNSSILRISQALHRNYFRFSRIINGELNTIPKETEVLIMDCIGYLAEAYYFGKYAYVGGGFGTGLHNILEPAAFNLPVIFGPIHDKFPEASIFIEEGIGFSVANKQEIMKHIQVFEHDLKSFHNRVEAYMESQPQSSKQIMKVLSEKKR